VETLGTLKGYSVQRVWYRGLKSYQSTTQAKNAQYAVRYTRREFTEDYTSAIRLGER